MAHTSMTYGVLPTREQFDEAFDRECPEGTFSFGNDERFGNDEVSERALWNELTVALGEFEDGEHNDECGGDGQHCNGECPGDRAGSWCSAVLGVLGFEWI